MFLDRGLHGSLHLLAGGRVFALGVGIASVGWAKRSEPTRFFAAAMRIRVGTARSRLCPS